MAEIEQLIDLLNKKQRLAAMLAPSFPVVYKASDIVGKLKRLGFAYVVEVTSGACRTNNQMLEALKKDEKLRFITSPCPSVVRLILTKYPELEKYLAKADSPMSATAKIVKENFPEAKPVFIGPCFSKKNEAYEDWPELNILVLTYKEMVNVFNHFEIKDEETDVQAEFDIKEKETRLYPLSGGLAQSSRVDNILADDELEVISGHQNCIDAIRRFVNCPNIRLLDILFCDGGCINGPGIESPLSIEERRDRVTAHWQKEDKNLKNA